MVIIASEVSRYKIPIYKNSPKKAILCQLNHQAKCLGTADVSHEREIMPMKDKPIMLCQGKAQMAGE